LAFAWLGQQAPSGANLSTTPTRTKPRLEDYYGPPAPPAYISGRIRRAMARPRRVAHWREVGRPIGNQRSGDLPSRYINEPLQAAEST
jgi:hypothetical protein